MSTTADRLARLLEDTPPRLAAISDADAGRRPAAEKWSRREILGHLIDSAANNHQRFVRAQLTPRLEFPNYEQESWVAAQSYATELWPDLVNLWLLLNRHLLHIVRAMPQSVLTRECAIGGKPAVPLRALVADYLSHMEHHLNQVFS
jgi:hypothetical protein